MNWSERAAWLAAGALAATSLLVLTGQTKRPGPEVQNYAPKIVRAGGFQVWQDGKIVYAVESELARFGAIESRLTTLENDVKALGNRAPSAKGDKPKLLPSEAVAEFRQTWITYQTTAQNISDLRDSHFNKPASSSDRDLANSLEMEQRTRWGQLMEVAKSLPDTHSQWRAVIEAISKRGIPDSRIAATFDPPIELPKPSR